MPTCMSGYYCYIHITADKFMMIVSGFFLMQRHVRRSVSLSYSVFSLRVSTCCLQPKWFMLKGSHEARDCVCVHRCLLLRCDFWPKNKKGMKSTHIWSSYFVFQEAHRYIHAHIMKTLLTDAWWFSFSRWSLTMSDCPLGTLYSKAAAPSVPRKRILLGRAILEWQSII